MAEKEQGSTALARRENQSALIEIAGVELTDTKGLMEHMRELQSRAFILSPAVGRIAPGYTVTPVVVVIDPSVDRKTGRGADVYYSPTQHAKRKVGDDDYEPLEVSLNKYGLLKILNAAGVDVQPTRWVHDARERYLWMATVEGFITDFDGRMRRLPSGTASLDARDGAADIGEWEPKTWAEHVKVAEAQKQKTPPAERWKCKPEPINGWTAERVRQVRNFGPMLTETKALNRLARNLGVRQSYTIAELRDKPFIIYRPMFHYDLSDPTVKHMLTAANLGARNLLYPGASADPATEPVHHGYGEPPIEGEAVQETATEAVHTGAAPADATDASFEEPQETPAVDGTYTVKAVKQVGKGEAAEYFVETAEGQTLYTREREVARGMANAQKAGTKMAADTERISVREQTYLQILSAQPAGGLKL